MRPVEGPDRTRRARIVADVAAAQSGVPDPAHSTWDAVGTGDNSGTARGALPAGFDVVVRDANNAPVVGVTVTLDFSSTPVRGYAAQDAGTTVNAAAHRLSRIAVTGATNFAARTARFDSVGLVQIWASGFAPTTLLILGDFSIFAAEFLPGGVSTYAW